MHDASPRLEYNIRQASEEDIKTIITIELSAASIFATIPELADLAGDHASEETIRHWLSAGRIYIVDYNTELVGYVAAIPMDTTIYIAELSTIREFQGKGVGGTLVEAVYEWARGSKELTRKARVSLITYREVPWNAPWYRKRGFKEVDAESIGPKHVEKMLYDEGERSLWRSGYTRCCMLWEED